MSQRKLRWRKNAKAEEEEEEVTEQITAPAAEVDAKWMRRWGAHQHIERDYFLRVMQRGSLHLRGLFDDPELLRRLYAEVRAQTSLPWSAHRIQEERGPEVLNVIRKLVHTFDIEKVVETRVNVYEGEDWKPRHQDRNAHDPDAGNYTCGASFFSERTLAFCPVRKQEQEEQEEDMFLFVQKSGDAFGFNDEVNHMFYHSIPRSCISKQTCFRVSIIVWGWQRKKQ